MRIWCVSDVFSMCLPSFAFCNCYSSPFPLPGRHPEGMARCAFVWHKRILLGGTPPKTPTLIWCTDGLSSTLTTVKTSVTEFPKQKQIGILVSSTEIIGAFFFCNKTLARTFSVFQRQWQTMQSRKEGFLYGTIKSTIKSSVVLSRLFVRLWWGIQRANQLAECIYQARHDA